MSIINLGIDEPPRGRRSRRRARRNCRSTNSAGPGTNACNVSSSKSEVAFGSASAHSIGYRSNYNRYTALLSTEEAPGAQSEKRALAPREPAWSERSASTSPATIDPSIRYAKESHHVQPETAALPAQIMVPGVRNPELTFPEADTHTLMDPVERIAPTSFASLQPQFTFTCPVAAHSSPVGYPPTVGSVFSSGAQICKNQTGVFAQQNHEGLRNSSCPVLGIPTGESRISAEQARDHRRNPDAAFATQLSPVEPSANRISPAFPPLTYQKRGWPSPTNSPPAPTTTDRKSRFFPTSLKPTPESTFPDRLTSDGSPFCFPVSYNPSDWNTSCFPTIVPSTIKPPRKKSPPPPIMITYSPLHSPVLIKGPPLPHSQITYPPGNIINTNDNKRHSSKKKRLTASQRPRPFFPKTIKRPQLQLQLPLGNMDLLRIKTAGFIPGQQDLGRGEAGEGEDEDEDKIEVEGGDEVEIGNEEIGIWERDMERQMEGWVGVERMFWGS